MDLHHCYTCVIMIHRNNQYTLMESKRKVSKI